MYGWWASLTLWLHANNDWRTIRVNLDSFLSYLADPSSFQQAPSSVSFWFSSVLMQLSTNCMFSMARANWRKVDCITRLGRLSVHRVGESKLGVRDEKHPATSEGRGCEDIHFLESPLQTEGYFFSLLYLVLLADSFIHLFTHQIFTEHLPGMLWARSLAHITHQLYTEILIQSPSLSAMVL